VKTKQVGVYTGGKDYREQEGKDRESGEAELKHRSDDFYPYRQMYEDVSRYEDEEAVLVATPPATKTMLGVRHQDHAGRQAPRPVGKRCRAAKTPLRAT